MQGLLDMLLPIATVTVHPAEKEVALKPIPEILVHSPA